MNGCYRLFSGDAARQRAELYAEKAEGLVLKLGSADAPFSIFGLDAWGRGWQGHVFSYVVITARPKIERVQQFEQPFTVGII